MTFYCCTVATTYWVFPSDFRFWTACLFATQRFSRDMLSIIVLYEIKDDPWG
jgi:hypothetical protein